MISAIKNMIKRVRSVGTTSDSGVIQRVTATYMGKEVDTQVFHDYGFVSSVPSGAMGFCLNPRGEENDRLSMFFHPSFTVKDLKQGETVVGNFFVEASLTFNAQGQAVLTLPDNFIINCNNLVATCQGDATISGSNVNITASASATITAPTITLDGVVAATQGMGVTGSMENNGVNVGSDHDHGAGTYKDSLNGDVSGDSDTPN